MACLAGPVTADDSDNANGSFPIPEHTAVYEVIRRGSTIGKLHVELKEGDDGRFVYTTESEATSTLARVIRASADEAAEFRFTNGEIKPLRYEQSTRIPGRHRFWEADFDWEDLRARGEDHNGELDVELSDSTLDPLTLRLKLALAIRQDGLAEDRYAFSVLERNEVEDQEFVNEGYFRIELPAGCLEAWQLERIREGSSRVFNSWHAPDFHFMPVRILQERDGRQDLDIRLIETSLIDGEAVCD